MQLGDQIQYIEKCLLCLVGWIPEDFYRNPFHGVSGQKPELECVVEDCKIEND